MVDASRDPVQFDAMHEPRGQTASPRSASYHSGGHAAAQGIRKKRLFVCCDGTWSDGVNNAASITNVSRLARSVKSVSDDGYLQVVYYDNGVGNGTDRLGQSVDGATGRGISPKIRNAYSFISHNYNFETPGDQIVLVGFSRGAFTVQCLASLIDQIGLLKKTSLGFLRGLYKLWSRQEQTVRSSYFGAGSETRIKLGVHLDDELENIERVHRIMTGEHSFRLRPGQVSIDVLAVWDTVSSLGMPIPSTSTPRPLDFVGRGIPRIVRSAFHALALNDSRRNFFPLVWESSAGSDEGTRLRDDTRHLVKQCWFLGAHGNVGGGRADAGLSIISFMWMAAQMESCIPGCLDRSSLKNYADPYSLAWAVSVRRHAVESTWRFVPHTAASGSVNKTDWMWAILGPRSRHKLLEGTKHWTAESPYIHWTVRLMMAHEKNKCELLESWSSRWHEGRLVWAPPAASSMGPPRPTGTTGGMMIPEDEMGGFEFNMLQQESERSSLRRQASTFVEKHQIFDTLVRRLAAVGLDIVGKDQDKGEEQAKAEKLVVFLQGWLGKAEFDRDKHRHPQPGIQYSRAGIHH